MNTMLSDLSHKKQSLDQFQPLAPELINNLREWFRVELTYTSNAIEGNTLTRQETALVVDKGLGIEGKVAQAGAVRLAATLKTPKGPVELC